jgi:AbrB family looped-hinge helix DNA binding protein
MAKVTSKLQVTIPKSLAQRCGIQSGDEIEWSSAGDGIRLAAASTSPDLSSIENRLELFDAATARQKKRQRGKRRTVSDERGWTREDLYDRGRSPGKSCARRASKTSGSSRPSKK